MLDIVCIGSPLTKRWEDNRCLQLPFPAIEESSVHVLCDIDIFILCVS